MIAFCSWCQCIKATFVGIQTAAAAAVAAAATAAAAAAAAAEDKIANTATAEGHIVMLLSTASLVEQPCQTGTQLMNEQQQQQQQQQLAENGEEKRAFDPEGIFRSYYCQTAAQ